MSIDFYRSRIKRKKTRDQFQCRCFAGAVGTEQPENLAVPNIEREIRNGVGSSVITLLTFLISIIISTSGVVVIIVPSRC